MPARGQRRKSSLYSTLYSSIAPRSAGRRPTSGRVSAGQPVPTPVYGPSARAQWSKYRQGKGRNAPLVGDTGGGMGFPMPPPPPGGDGTPSPAWEEFGYSVEGAPAQWKALRPAELNERTEWLATMNMMIPFLSPQDQLQVATILAKEEPEAFGNLASMRIGSPTLDQQAQMREQYGGRRKLLQALEGLGRFRGAVGKSEQDMGKGYQYLVDLAGRMADFSGYGAPQSRLDYMNMMSQLEPMLEAVPESYRGVAQMLLQPTFTGGTPIGQMMGNQYQWGTPSRLLWT